MKVLYSFVYIIFLLSLFHVSESIIFEDLTVPNTNNIYAQYPSYCQFSYKLLLKSNDSDIVHTGFQTSNGTISQVIYNTKVEDLNRAIVRFKLSIPINTNGSFTMVNDEVPIVGSIQYACEQIKYPLVNLNTNLNFESLGNLYAYRLLLNNLNKEIPITSFQVADPFFACSFTQPQYSLIMIGCGGPLNFANAPNNFTLLITDNLMRQSTIVLNSFITYDTRTPVVQGQTYFDDTSALYPSKLVYNVVNVKNFSRSLTASTIQGKLVFGNENNYQFLYRTLSSSIYLLQFKFQTFQNQIFSERYAYNYSFSSYGNSMTLLTALNQITFSAYSISILCTYEGFYSKLKFEYSFSGIYKSVDYDYPYGVQSLSQDTVNFGFTNIISPFNNSLKLIMGINSPMNGVVPMYSNFSDTTVSTLNSLELIKISSYSFIIRIGAANSGSGIYSIRLGVIEESPKLYPWDLISGDINNGLYEKYYDIRSNSDRNLIQGIAYNGLFTLTIISMSGVTTTINEVNNGGTLIFPGSPFSPNSNLIYTSSNVLSVSHVSFSINNIDLSLIGCDTTMYLNFTNVDITQTPRISSNDIEGFSNIPLEWDSKLKMYSGVLKIPQGIFSKNIYYSIRYLNVDKSSLELPDEWQLKVKSDYADQMAPIIEDFTSFYNESSDAEGGGIITWTFLISDQINGFKNGTITVITDREPFLPIQFNIKPTSSQNIFLDNYYVSVTVPPSCLTLTYQIQSIMLIDNSGYSSQYTYQNRDPLLDNVSPLMKFLDNSTKLLQLSVLADCGTQYTDFTPPDLTDLESEPLSNITIDVSSSNRRAYFIFRVTDASNEIIKNDVRYLPTCYLHAIFFRKISVISTLVGNSTNQALFKCVFDIPYGFGYPEDHLSLSIHGYSDVQLNVGGVTADDILAVGFESNVKITFLFENPIIENVVPIDGFTNESTSITISGHNFNIATDNTSTIVSIETDSINIMSYKKEAFSRTLLIVDNITPINQPFNLSIYFGSTQSNIIRVVPILISRPPTIPPIITKPPNAVCPGTPQCSGDSNGNCISGVCQCKDPWFGDECQYQTIIVKPPIINQTSPEIINDYNTTLPDGKEVTLVSLISIISLKELKYDGSLVNEHFFDQWIYTNNTNSLESNNIEEYVYSTNITNNNYLTRVNVFVQYFKSQDTIYFANEKLEMKPSTIKYKIVLSPYKFTSELNNLQIIMGVTLEQQSNSLENNSCSYQESGDIPESNSEYVKLQIDTHSLYGRFIKRGIIDNRIKSISNTIYQNVRNSSTNSLSESFIGINIPFYKANAIIDPDFSLLIDVKSASQQLNSICNIVDSQNSNGLSKSQLAGIIIGVIGFVSIIVISVTYYIYKKKQHKKLSAHMAQKLKGFQE